MALDPDQADAANALRATAHQLHEPPAFTPPAPTLPPISVLRVFAKAGYLGLAAWTLLCLIWAASAFSLVGLTPDGSGAVAGGFAILFVGAIWAGGILVGAVVIVATTMLARDVPTSAESGRREWRLAAGVVGLPVAMFGLMWLIGLTTPSPVRNTTPARAVETTWSGGPFLEVQTPPFSRTTAAWQVSWEASGSSARPCHLRVVVYWAGANGSSFQELVAFGGMPTTGTVSSGAMVDRSGVFYLRITPNGCGPWTVSAQ